MADTKTTGLIELAATPAVDDLLPIVDISDTTQGVGGSMKKITRANLIGGLETTSGAQAKVDAHVDDATDAHDATAISNAPSGSIAATTVQAAIDELASEKAATAHNHAAADINSGTLDVARVPTGTSSSTVALGDHTHSGGAGLTMGQGYVQAFNISTMP